MKDFTKDIYMKMAEAVGESKSDKEFDMALHRALGEQFDENVDSLMKPVDRMCEEWFKRGFRAAFQFMAEQLQDSVVIE